MRHTRRLDTLYVAARKCLRRLRVEVEGIDRRLPERQIEVPMCRVTIDAHNTWANFARAYFLSVMYGTKRMKGPRVIGGHGLGGLTEDLAIEMAIIALDPKKSPRIACGGTWHRREEPTWHDSTKFLNICTALKFPNIVEIRNGLSSGSRVFLDLPVFRNYFAHRNRRTRFAAVSLAPRYGIPPLERPSQILLRRPLNVGQSLILDWLDYMELTVEFLCD